MSLKCQIIMMFLTINHQFFLVWVLQATVVLQVCVQERNNVDGAEIRAGRARQRLQNMEQ